MYQISQIQGQFLHENPDCISQAKAELFEISKAYENINTECLQCSQKVTTNNPNVIVTVLL